MLWLGVIAKCLSILCSLLSLWLQQRYYDRGDFPRATYYLVSTIGFGLLSWWNFR